MKFNVDGTVKGKPGLARIAGVLLNNKGDVLFMFSKHADLRESNEVDMLSTLKALMIFLYSFHGRVIVENDSTNAISWLTSMEEGRWKLNFYFNEINFSYH